MKFPRNKWVLIGGLILIGLVLWNRFVMPLPLTIPLALDTWDILSGRGKLVNSDKRVIAYNWDAYKLKYPVPKSKRISQEIENELYNWWIKRNGFHSIGKSEFCIDNFFGDVATGAIVGAYKDVHGKCMGQAHWIVNKINGEWTIIYLAQTPDCDSLKPYLSYLKDWQGNCLNSEGLITNIKHPEFEIYKK